MSSNPLPAEVFHPGVFLEATLGDEAEKWAALIDAGLNVAYIERLREGDARINQNAAVKLAKALGTTALLWINLQQQFDQWQERGVDRE